LQVSDPTGQYETVVFSDGLAKYEDLLEAGQSLVLLVNAEDKPEGISLRLQSVTALEAEAAKVQKHLRIFVRDEKPLSGIPKLIGKPGEASVSLVILQGQGEREVEVGLQGKRHVTPQVAGAIKAISGVIDVELV